MEPVAAALAQLAEAQAVCDFLTGLCAKELEALSDYGTHPDRLLQLAKPRGIGLRRLGCGCGRRLVTGSCVFRETT